MDDDIMGELDGKGREESKPVWARVCTVDESKMARTRVLDTRLPCLRM